MCGYASQYQDKHETNYICQDELAVFKVCRRKRLVRLTETTRLYTKYHALDVFVLTHCFICQASLLSNQYSSKYIPLYSDFF